MNRVDSVSRMILLAANAITLTQEGKRDPDAIEAMIEALQRFKSQPEMLTDLFMRPTAKRNQVRAWSELKKGDWIWLEQDEVIRGRHVSTIRYVVEKPSGNTLGNVVIRVAEGYLPGNPLPPIETITPAEYGISLYPNGTWERHQWITAVTGQCLKNIIDDLESGRMTCPHLD